MAYRIERPLKERSKGGKRTEDEKIIELFFRRDETAVAEAQKKYLPYCMGIARNLLSDGQDAEECVNDAFLQAWNRIPPERPRALKAWLGKVVHDISINLWKKSHAQKRFCGIPQVLEELEESIPSRQDPERDVEAAELGAAIDRWLDTLSARERSLFICRYWHGMPLKELAEKASVSPGRLAQQMYRLRRSLKAFLEQEEQI